LISVAKHDRCWGIGRDLARCLQPIQLWKANFEDDKIRPEPPRYLDGCAAISNFSAHFIILVVRKNGFNTDARNLVSIGDQNANCSHEHLSGLAAEIGVLSV
jgi:hypothetical protein